LFFRQRSGSEIPVRHRSLIFGGKTILAGLTGGYLAVEIAKKILGIRTRTGDSFVVPVAGSIAVGRLSCFVGGCCFGTETHLPWGVVFPTVDLLTRHPTQLYEFLFHSAAAIVFAALRTQGILQNRLFRIYLIAYCIYRFFSEYLRPETRLWWGLTAYQWAAMLLAFVFLNLLLRDPESPQPAPAPQ
jgi:prolipoprotein diacylglyceryltransferase